MGALVDDDDYYYKRVVVVEERRPLEAEGFTEDCTYHDERSAL